MELLETSGISKSFDAREVIRDISVRLSEGEIVSLLGLSGSGKSTLLNIISGLVRPDAGKVFLSGTDITGRPGQVSYMLQKDLLLEHKRVIDNVTLPLVIRGMKKEEAAKQANGYFEQFGLAGTERMYPAQLSGGMRQRAALLRTYMTEAPVALLDEPFSALDTLTKSEIHRWFLGVMEKIKLSTVFITHDIDEAILLSDRIYLLGGKPGTITDEITIDEPKPRSADFNLTDRFLAYKRLIISKLK